MSTTIGKYDFVWNEDTGDGATRVDLVHDRRGKACDTCDQHTNVYFYDADVSGCVQCVPCATANGHPFDLVEVRCEHTNTDLHAGRKQVVETCVDCGQTREWNPQAWSK